MKSLTYWQLTQRNRKRQSNRSQAICFSWQEQKSWKYWKSWLRERGDYQFYTPDSHWGLKAIHRIKTSKGSRAWQVPKVKSPLCIRNINWFKSFISIEPPHACAPLTNKLWNYSQSGLHFSSQANVYPAQWCCITHRQTTHAHLKEHSCTYSWSKGISSKFSKLK